ncbi:MAG: peptidylprolyl isomerase, partial [Candidatus Omnitrophica bacterium]|nr:peptidylprolyl isomerase [Candidatus Omnitrophota bacterium]
MRNTKKHLYNKKTQRIIWIVLMLFIMPAFILLGLKSGDRSQQGSDYVGKIFGKRVSFAQFRDSYSATRNRAIMQFGDKVKEVEKLLNLESQAWDRLVLLAEAKRRKIRVSDQEVITAIQTYAFFQQKEKFDQGLYEQLLKYVFGSNPRSFEEEIRQNLAISKLYDLITKSVMVAEKETKDEYRKNNEKLSIEYIRNSPEEYIKDVVATDWQMNDYYNKNSLEFKEPPAYNLEYIMPTSETQANAIAFQLKKNEPLEKISKDFSLAIKETGLFSQTESIPGIGFSQEVIDIISKMKPGNMLPILAIYDKYYVMRIKEKNDAYVPDFDKVKEKVRESLALALAKDMAKTKIEECLKRMQELQDKNKQVDFEDNARYYGLKGSSTESFGQNDYLEEFGPMDVFFLEAQNLEDNKFSKVISLTSGYYIIRKKSFTPIDEKKYQQEKKEFQENLLSMKKQEFFNKFLWEL